jgi:hypothetical protein
MVIGQNLKNLEAMDRFSSVRGSWLIMALIGLWPSGSVPMLLRRYDQNSDTLAILWLQRKVTVLDGLHMFRQGRQSLYIRLT